ncbi:hypothetical protein SAMD00019534_034870 [Acytostelium subglobosum LB1]|uniref:hypothetical protein n=1 Tax=Acytostelium subglobosum LB1 TaxID=1410327 RepID=UPI000644AFC6|nr:hypothetical protein SAMD00019534_034870 [Acytostelium subglobosum LB1]GAM20312.1 hypothetical protein SAMD00019534_034870 [Acytostelium subglobosum LB1]|eukprot:XP_012759833.1 hypothetical protein SAMD00019534_034870 [Acytostelium subglobosum LB1]
MSESLVDLSSPIPATISNDGTSTTTTTTTTTATKDEKENTKPQSETFSVKSITFQDKKRNIVTQKENGPCPLIALANVLSLRGRIELPERPITYDDLVMTIGSYLLEDAPNQFQNGQSQFEHEIKMNQSMNILPSLVNGLILDIRFTGIRDFDTRSCDINIFDLLNIELVHGWLVDPQDVELTSLVGEMTYNQIVEKLYMTQHQNNKKKEGSSSTATSPSMPTAAPAVSSSSSTSTSNGKDKDKSFFDEFDPIPSVHYPSLSSEPAPSSSSSSSTTTTTTSTTSTTSTSTTTTSPQLTMSDKAKAKQPMDKFGFPSDILTPEEDAIYSSGVAKDDLSGDMRIAQFLKDTSSQLSYHGLCELHTHLAEGQLSILFRNNHFCTLYKFNNELYQLITDEGYINEPVVWERLSQINGDTDYLQHDFTPFSKMDPFSTFHQGKGSPPPANPTEFMTDEEYAKYLSEQPTNAHDTDRDFALALQLQNQENQKKAPKKSSKPDKDKEKEKDKDGKEKKCKLQ